MTTILSLVERFLLRNPEITPTKLGRQAVTDPGFVFALRGTSTLPPRKIKPATEARVRAYMQAYEARKATGADSSVPIQVRIWEAEARIAEAVIAAERAAAVAQAAAAQAEAATATLAAARVEDARAA